VVFDLAAELPSPYVALGNGLGINAFLALEFEKVF
jgi:hypothetical protein